ncbi:MAG: hypothetical protein R3D58_12580 [Saprospiraceae bacterium]
MDTLTQGIGITPDYKTESDGQIVFSPDGSKIYRTNPRHPVMVYSFDRQAGVITQFDTIAFDYGVQPVIGEIGCAVSPNGRFIYLGCRQFLYQLDLWASDISASQTVVAEWDGYAAPIPTMFYQLQLGPDCKIYGLGGGDTRFFHVIHNPDEPGLTCTGAARPAAAHCPAAPPCLLLNYHGRWTTGPFCSPVVNTTALPTPLPAFFLFLQPGKNGA